MAGDHWPLHARSWARVGPPLRPCAEDVALVAAELAARADVLVLGVTPELIALPLPEGSTVVAVEREPAMIDALFAPGPGRRAAVGSWLAMPLADASIDVAVGDGCTTLLAYPDEQAALAAELARVLRPGGRVVLRVFVLPAVPEALGDIAVASARSFDALKWRVAMAVQPPSRAVPVRAIRDAFDALVPDRDALPWPRDVIDHIDIYRDSPAVYAFPTLDELRAVFAPRFVEVACHVPRYELGDRCPTLVWRRR